MAKQITASGTGKFFFLITASILLAILPLLIFRPIKQKSTPPVQKSRFTFMTNTPTSVQDPHDLVYWQKAGNPMLFAKPDSQYGFSAFFKPEQRHRRPGNIADSALPELQKILPAPSLQIETQRTPAELLSDSIYPVISTEKTTEPLLKTNAPAVAIFEDGTVIPLKDIAEDDLKGARLEPAAFHIKQKQNGAPPEIRLIRSSGNSKLDQLALRQLFLPAAQNKNFNGILRVEWDQKGARP